MSDEVSRVPGSAGVARDALAGGADGRAAPPASALPRPLSLDRVFERVWLEDPLPAAPPPRALLLRLSGVAAVNLLALLVGFLIAEEHSAIPILVFMAAVMASSWLGGRVGGLAAVAFCTWAANYLVFGPNTMAVDYPDDFLRLCAFAASALLVSTVNSSRAVLERADEARRQAERSRRWAEGLLEEEMAPLLLLSAETGEVLFANRAARDLAGGRLPAGEPGSGEFFTSLGKTLASNEMPAARAARGEPVPPVRLEWHLPEGTRKLLVTAQTMGGKEGMAPFVLLSYQDLTEVDNAALSLRRSEALYETLAEAAPVGIFQVDARGRLLYTNDRARELLGLPVEADGLPLEQLCHPDWTDPSAEWQGMLGRGVTARFECRSEAAGGRWVRIGLSPVRDLEEVVSYVGTVDDLTERKRAEQEMQRLSEHRAELVTTVSHTLRAPIAAMLANLDVLRDNVSDELRPQDQRFLDNSVRSALDLSATVDAILAFSRLQRAPAELCIEDCALPEVLRRVYERMLRRGISCSVSLELEVPGEVRAVRTDERQLEVLLTELVENAVKYTPAGGSVQLGIRDGQEGVRLTVRDTGPGFRPEEIPHLFEPFFRGKSAGESQVKGSGLGLAIAARLAELLGGQLSAANGAGGGAQLELYLPRGGNGQSSAVNTFEKPRS